MEHKHFVLLSGGLDSCAVLAGVLNGHDKENTTAVAVKYGQKHSKELEHARSIAEYYQIEFKILDLSEIFKGGNCSLLKSSDEKIPTKAYDGKKVSTYVPFRNGLMLSALASFAMNQYPDNPITLYLGNHGNDVGNAYADCSIEFVNKMDAAIREGTYDQVNLNSPFADNTKADIVNYGAILGAPFHLTWSCYEGEEEACGKCGTCIDRLEAFKSNNMKDPINYKK